MKPLPRIALTEEDIDIWVEVSRRRYRHCGRGTGYLLVVSSVGADRRDAALMRQAQEIAEFGPAAIELYGIACRGWNSRGYWIERDDEDGEGTWQRD